MKKMKKCNFNHGIILCIIFILEILLGFIVYFATSTLTFEKDIYRFVSNTDSKVVLKSFDKEIVLKNENSERMSFPKLSGPVEVYLPNDRKFLLEYIGGSGNYAMFIHSDGSLKDYTMSYLSDKVYLMTTKEYEESPIYNSKYDTADKKQKTEIKLLDDIISKRYSFIELVYFIIYLVVTGVCFELALGCVFFISYILKSRGKSTVCSIILGYVFSIISPILLLFI